MHATPEQVSGVITLRGAGAYQLNGKPMLDFDERDDLVPVVGAGDYRWNTAVMPNGAYRLTQPGGAADALLKIQNGPGTVETNLRWGQTASGTLKWTATAIDIPGSTVMFLMDGASVYPSWWSIQPGDGPHSASMDLDTRAFPNGPYELTVVAWKTGEHRITAMAQVVVNIDNGDAPRGIIPNYGKLFLVPGEAVRIEQSMLDCNGNGTPASGCAFSVENAAIATVGVEGLVTGVASGLTTVLMKRPAAPPHGGDTVKIAVEVRTTKSFPHFARDGEILTEYVPGRSAFLASAVYASPSAVEETPELAQELKKAGFTNLESTIHLDPDQSAKLKSVEEYKAAYHRFWDREAAVARGNGFGLTLVADNLTRWPDALRDGVGRLRDAVAYEFALAQHSGIVTNVDMCDEVTSFHGKRPPDEIQELVKLIPCRPPISWPILWNAGPEAAAAWMGDPKIADYASLYWDPSNPFSFTTVGASQPQMLMNLELTVANYLPGLQLEKPRILLAHLGGSYYHKRGKDGTHFVKGRDYLVTAGLRPEQVSAQVLYAVAAGLCGVRAYAYDWRHWKNYRALADNPRDVQTGASPFDTGVKRWRAMANALNLVHKLGPKFLQPQAHAPHVDWNIYTGARAGKHGRVLIVINFWERPRKLKLDPGLNVRHRVHGESLKTENVRGADQFEMLPGEAIVWEDGSDQPQSPPAAPGEARTPR